jgi:hypothetical protein
MAGRLLFCLLLLGASSAWAADYAGPMPPTADMIYLVHADNLIATEAGEAKQEKGDTYSIPGVASSARTPLAEPIFLLKSEKLSAESLELYRLEAKGGRRETTVSSKRRGGRALHLQVTRLERGLYRIEASETLENGEYALTPAGSNRVFCFEVY